MEIALIVVVGAMLVFFMFNNRKKQKQRQEQLSNDLVPGATVMTSFGLFGTVVEVDEAENKVTIESGPGTTLVLHKQAIGQIQAPQAVAAEETAPEAPEAEPEAREPVAEVPVESEEQVSDGKPRITDAELDAMNEAKRSESLEQEVEQEADARDSIVDESDESGKPNTSEK